MPYPDNIRTKNHLKFDLSDGEKELWTGEAGTGIKFTPRDIFFVPFSIVWFTGVLIWEAVVLIGMPLPFNVAISLIGVPFVLLGFYMTIGRFVYDLRRRANTSYILTTKRLIIRSGFFKPITEIFDIQTLYAMEINEKSDGSGTIKLDADNPPYSAWKSGYVFRKEVWAIEHVPNVRSIYNMILEQQETLNKLSLIKHQEEIASIISVKNKN